MNIKKGKKNNGCLYYRYLLVYVNDVLSIGEDSDGPINMLEQVFRLKEGYLGQTGRYLGAII